MSQHLQAPEGKDPELWDIAQSRVDFKDHLLFYLIVNGFFWALWFFTDHQIGESERFPWPVWSMLGWGIWLAFDFAEAYLFSHANSAEYEYQQLKNKQ
jgi:hypothetical protein